MMSPSHLLKSVLGAIALLQQSVFAAPSYEEGLKFLEEKGKEKDVVALPSGLM
jgi:hypothetical protein